VAQHVTLAGGTFDIYAGGVPRRLSKHAAGIIGFGRIGRAVSIRLRAFYGKVLAYDPYVPSDMMDAFGVSKVDFNNLLSTSDCILLHCLLNAETIGMLDAPAFGRMKPGTFLVNAARGKLVDSRALYEALLSGKIAGAGLDVFHPENPHEDPWYSKLVKLPNVVVTSHRAYLSQESEISQRVRVAEGIRQVIETGIPPATGHLTEGGDFRP
jgi:phosphoglycerate dehydrogenase-like enzyme